MKEENSMHREPNAPQKNNFPPNKRKENITAPEHIGPGAKYVPKDNK